ncbi:flagellar assembly peptidoglycan hydrolase FlgJ [Aquitalea sp. FJL05]|uniref:flagellar assembly peptidoglycan hydrolase FlgJ n=1 Tax=Aquitalea TaxID=407217 RepID=UPI000F5A5687|nr:MULTISPECIES: flagellar assembly peptidoglycan hydrolase FlgJ [Aquitalea]RQO73060.1 flagellar assembly peptidoglycan hydrolase FlgJ [Aquitalea sp. FJL05]
MTTQFSSTYSANDALSQQLAVDPTQMSSLRARMSKDPQGAAKEAASQFEALLMGTMLKTMRETKFDDEGDSAMDTYRGMLDQQMVQSLSRAGGMGIADLVYKQIAKQSGFDAGTDASKLHSAASSPVLPTRFTQASGVKAYQAAQSEAASAGLASNTAAAAASSSPVVSGDGKSFIQGMLPHARNAASQLGVAPEFVVAHAALESGWGKRAIRNADGSNSHNLFGIKATGDWQGKSTSITTTEYVNGTAQKKVEKFRSYDSYADAFSDYASLLKGSPRYQAALNQGRNVQGFAQGLQSGGYATDPRYARKLVDVAASLAQQAVRS